MPEIEGGPEAAVFLSKHLARRHAFESAALAASRNEAFIASPKQGRCC